MPKTQMHERVRGGVGVLSSHRREVLRDLDLVDDDKLVLAARVLPLVVACARVTVSGRMEREEKGWGVG